MTTDYVLNTIKRILDSRVIQEPNCVPHKELVREVCDDLKLAVDQLVAEKQIRFQRALNDTLYYVVESGDKNGKAI